MNASVKSALGIDITETRVSTVLLGKTAQGVRVLDAAQFPLPDGTFEQGRIANPALLLKVLKAAKARNKTRTRHVALSLPIMSTVTRVVQLDEEDPQRIAQFVQNEIKEYAALSGREVVSDFRVLVPARYDASGKVLMTAMDNHLAASVTWVCRRARLGVSVIEPAGMACMRVLGGTESARRSPERMLLVVLKEGLLNLCVLRRGILEFVRTEQTTAAHGGLDEIHSRVADEINAIIQFYDNESAAAAEPWSVVILDDDDLSVAEDTVGVLKANVAADAVDIRTTVNCSDLFHVAPESEGLASITAFGLAMRFLVEDEAAPGINLLPPEAIRAKSVRTNMLLAANTVAVFILVVILIMGGLRFMIKHVTQNVVAMRMSELKRGQHTLSAAAIELAYIEQRRESLASDLASLRHISESHVDAPWTQLLDDIKNATPEVLCVTDLTVDATSDLSMEGLSHSYDAVHLFVEMLNRSERITRASVAETGRSTTDNELVQYVIRCTLATGKTR